MICKFRNSGQTCISANRIYVQDSIHDAFVERLAAAMAALQVGAGIDDRSNVGPLIDEDALAKVERHVADAQAHGAELRLGGSRHALGGTFFQPTLLTGIDVRHGDDLRGDVRPGRGHHALPRRAGGDRAGERHAFGLAAYFYSRDIGRIWRVAEGLETGIVGINTGFISNEVAPFGGVKESGIGREGSKYGIEEWMEVKYLCMGGI